MAFDGFVISNIVNELNEKILNGRIYKIYQPEADETEPGKSKAPSFCQSEPADRLSFEPGQTEPDTGPQLLYAASEASGQRAYHLRRTAGL